MIDEKKIKITPWDARNLQELLKNIYKKDTKSGKNL